MNTRTKAWLAYAYIAVIWGTTYYAIRVAVTHYPPFLMAGVRQLVAFLLIAIIALSLNRKANLSRRNMRRNAIIGLLMITIGNGVVSWAEQVVPSGAAALLCSMMPIAVVILNLLFSRNDKPNTMIGIGMVLGFAGVALIFRNDVKALGNTQYLLGIVATLFATFGWAGGSILSRRWSDPVNPMMDAGMQVGFGGLFLILFSPLADNYRTAHWHNTDALWALIYLIVLGSVFAFTAYRYALKNLPVGFVTSYAYVNPLIAVVLGFFAGEKITGWTFLSFAAIITGVFLVSKGYKKQETIKKSVDMEMEAAQAPVIE